MRINAVSIVTHHVAETLVMSLGSFAWLVYVRTYCVPIATLSQNKQS